MNPDVEMPNTKPEDLASGDAATRAHVDASELLFRDFQSYVRALLSVEGGAVKAMRTLRSLKARRPPHGISSVHGGVLEEDEYGTYCAALHTEHGPVVLQDATRTDRPDDPQAIAIPDHKETKPPLHRRDLERTINDSRQLLELDEDWDDAGASPISVSTWERATSFLRHQADFMWSRDSHVLPIPDIMPVADGSIDLHWEAEDYELLINVPSDSQKPASFYGDDYGEIQIRGTLDPERTSTGLIEWLSRC